MLALPQSLLYVAALSAHAVLLHFLLVSGPIHSRSPAVQALYSHRGVRFPARWQQQFVSLGICFKLLATGDFLAGNVILCCDTGVSTNSKSDTIRDVEKVFGYLPEYAPKASYLQQVSAKRGGCGLGILASSAPGRLALPFRNVRILIVFPTNPFFLGSLVSH